jgi:glycosyltransferase involved in cell wall biosynthesis
MQVRKKLVYLNDLVSPYDSFFLKRLKRIYNVTCVTFSYDPNRFSQVTRLIRIRDSPFRLPRLDGIRIWGSTLSRAFLLKNILNNLQPDIVIAYDALSYGFYSALTGFKPFLLFVWGSDVLIWPQRSLLFKSVAEYSLKKADAILVDSDVQAKACIRLGAPVGKIIRVPWFDVNEAQSFKVKDETKQEIRLNLGFSEDEIIVISTRLHEPIYSVETLIFAMSELLKQNPKVRLLILGRGSRTPFLKRLAQSQGVSHKVEFVGKVNRERVFEYLQVSDIYVSTSLSDGTSSCLLEAMSCKLPVVVTDIPGNREWIIDQHNGLLFPVKAWKWLALKIVELIENEDLRKSFGKKAYATVAEKANWSKNSGILDNLISSLIITKQD